MNRKELDEAFEKVAAKSEKYWSPEECLKRIDKFTDDNGKLDMYQMVYFLQSQSADYTNRFVRTVLEELLLSDQD
ncbi:MULTISPECIES: hypothetical protein [Leuconostoc]|uniref:hypothetical protein n=1 Tax=Lactobacillaceae TaxID=33958 RepID=UPI001CC1BB6D|nr:MULTISPECIES: hypothetical protein [Leuconostoc]MBZ1505996.1 hypothetical protein [Leuconostoc mesenteroides]NLT85647.1 hypothetical protein [Leuconostoc sp.]